MVVAEMSLFSSFPLFYIGFESESVGFLTGPCANHAYLQQEQGTVLGIVSFLTSADTHPNPLLRCAVYFKLEPL